MLSFVYQVVIFIPVVIISQFLGDFYGSEGELSFSAFLIAILLLTLIPVSLDNFFLKLIHKKSGYKVSKMFNIEDVEIYKKDIVHNSIMDISGFLIGGSLLISFFLVKFLGIVALMNSVSNDFIYYGDTGVSWLLTIGLGLHFSNSVILRTRISRNVLITGGKVFDGNEE